MESVDEVARSGGLRPNQVKLAWLLRRSPAMAPSPGRSTRHTYAKTSMRRTLISPYEEFEQLSG